jgi:hypothetical protein
LAIVEERLNLVGAPVSELRLDVIGVDSVYAGPRGSCEAMDVRARIAGRTATLRDAQQIGREIEAVWINGPAGGGGATWSAREVIAAASALIPRAVVRPTKHVLES